MGKTAAAGADAQVSDPTRYYTPLPPGTETVTMTGRVDKLVARRVDEIVASGRFKFKTRSDVVRASLDHYIHQVLAPRMDRNFSLAIKQREDILHWAQRVAEVKSARQYSGKLISSLKSLLLEQCLDEAARVYSRAVWTLGRQEPAFRDRVLGSLEADEVLDVVRERAQTLPPNPDEIDQEPDMHVPDTA